jgi:uncharacterized protein
MPITREEVLGYLQASRERFRREYGVSRLGVFGSTGRGEAAETSDLDVIVEMDNPTFDRYMDLKFELEDHFGVEVDLVLAGTVKDRLRPVIERETVYV